MIDLTRARVHPVEASISYAETENEGGDSSSESGKPVGVPEAIAGHSSGLTAGE